MVLKRANAMFQPNRLLQVTAVASWLCVEETAECGMCQSDHPLFALLYQHHPSYCCPSGCVLHIDSFSCHQQLNLSRLSFVPLVSLLESRWASGTLYLRLDRSISASLSANLRFVLPHSSVSLLQLVRLLTYIIILCTDNTLSIQRNATPSSLLGWTCSIYACWQS